MNQFFQIFSAEKDFAHPWIGDPRLNQAGLHLARIGLSEVCARVRKLRRGIVLNPVTVATLRRDGVVTVPNFLAPIEFEALQSEARTKMVALAERVPPRLNSSHGFGPKLPFEGGFDRHDGGTLNRFVFLDESTPRCLSLTRNRRFRRIYRAAATVNVALDRVTLHQTIHGNQLEYPDLQKVLHRDTFHWAVKLWYFLEDVPLDCGPLEYCLGSHRQSRARLRWEYRRSLLASSGGNVDGSFRVSADEVRSLGLEPPQPVPVKANTLVLADVRGFHRRGHAREGRSRLCLYANLRPRPFTL